MGGKIPIWTRQNADIMKILNCEGRYIVKKKYIEQKMGEYARLYFDVYNWYVAKAARLVALPPDVCYPIWVSLAEEHSLGASEGNVMIEALVDSSLVIVIDLGKWGRIVNYMYIPSDKADEEEHEMLLKSYNIDDCTAYMSNFYPHIRHKIIKSWERLFDKSVTLSPNRIGTIWELKEEWITKITE